MKPGILFIAISLFCCCQNSPGKVVVKSDVVSKTDSAGYKVKNIAKYDSTIFLETSDVYRYENDTILQVAYIHYVSVHEISFLLRTVNKRNRKTSEIRDTAELPDPIGDPDTYEDELDSNNLYPVYEYTNRQGKFRVNIGIEPSGGKRLAVTVSKDFKRMLDEGCPVESVQTLRRVKLSSVKQIGPELPK